MSVYPVISQEHEGLRVVRGDLYPGGLKCRVLSELLRDEVAAGEVVYAGCYFGHTNFAIGLAGLLTGKRVTLFLTEPECDTYIHRMVKSLNNVRCIPIVAEHQDELFETARRYARDQKAELLPIGLNFAPFRDRYVKVMRSVCDTPREIWVSGGSGVSARCLQEAWPTANVNVVDLNVRPNPDFGSPKKVWKIPEKLREESVLFPPWSAARYYDAKMWQVLRENASQGAVVWSIA